MLPRTLSSASRATTRLSRLSNTFRAPFATSAMCDITLYSWPTPNGTKATITLEELGLPYKSEAVNIMNNTQKEECVSVLIVALIRKTNATCADGSLRLTLMGAFLLCSMAHSASSKVALSCYISWTSTILSARSAMRPALQSTLNRSHG